jgi:hypothetical protein
LRSRMSRLRAMQFGSSLHERLEENRSREIEQQILVAHRDALKVILHAICQL